MIEVTATDTNLASRPLLLLRDGGWLREGVARRHTPAELGTDGAPNNARRRGPPAGSRLV